VLLAFEGLLARRCFSRIGFTKNIQIAALSAFCAENPSPARWFPKVGSNSCKQIRIFLARAGRGWGRPARSGPRHDLARPRLVLALAGPGLGPKGLGAQNIKFKSPKNIHAHLCEMCLRSRFLGQQPLHSA